MAEREALLNQVLGDRKLTIREIGEHMSKLLGVELYESDARSLVNRLYATRHLNRVGEQWHNKVRYRYFLPTELHGPIADLERLLEETA